MKSYKGNQVVTTPVDVTKEPTHRYYCDACTGIAFLYTDGDILPRKVTCKACGAFIPVLYKENLIPLK